VKEVRRGTPGDRHPVQGVSAERSRGHTPGALNLGLWALRVNGRGAVLPAASAAGGTRSDSPPCAGGAWG